MTAPPRVARCAGCGKPASGSWLTFSIDAAPGPRGGNRISTVRTEVHTVRICASCTDSPAWAWLARLLQDKGQPAEGWGGQCVVLCSSHRPKRSHRWAKLHPHAVITWPQSGLYRCPMCYRRARGWTINAAPRAVRDLAASIVRRRRIRPQPAPGMELAESHKAGL